MLEIIELLFLGIFVGIYGTIVGIGGGFLIVPIMLLVYKMTPQYAIGTSLLVIFFNSLSATVAYVRQKRIDYKSGIIFSISTFPGAIIGAYLSNYFNLNSFKILFSFLLFGASLFLILSPKKNEVKSEFDSTSTNNSFVTRTIVDSSGQFFKYQFNLIIGIVVSFFVGFFSSILGLGGGIIHVPSMIYLLNFPPHLAVATSHFILLFSTFVGAISHITLKHIFSYQIVFILAIGAIIGAQIGARLSKNIKGKILVRLLAIALIFVAIRLFFL
jgi:uncharacterized membrane protein YfcA